MARLPASVIAACAMDRAIGRGGRLPWALPADWAFFCAATRGQALVVGRRSFLEFDGPIPGRLTIVVSADAALRRERERWPELRVAHSLSDALALADDDPLFRQCRRVFVGGGQRLFEEAMLRPEVESCYVSRVHRWVPDADAFFPAWTRYFPTLRYCASSPSVSFQVWARA